MTATLSFLLLEIQPQKADHMGLMYHSLLAKYGIQTGETSASVNSLQCQQVKGVRFGEGTDGVIWHSNETKILFWAEAGVITLWQKLE